MDLLKRLEALRDSRAKARAEHEVAKEALSKARAGLKALGIETDADLDVLKLDVVAKMVVFEKQIQAAEDELVELSNG